MKRRCFNPNNERYKDYGGRGITMCEQWKNDFLKFMADMGERPSKKHSIDRIDNDKGYCKQNCRWATTKEQNNNMRSNRLITYNNETHNMSEWAEILGLKYHTLTARIYSNNYDIEKSFTTIAKQRDTKKITYQGKTQLISEWAKEYNIPYGLLNGRLDAGWDVERALTEPAKGTNVKLITFNGESLSLEEWALKLNLPKHLLTNRFSRGWSIEESLSPKVEKSILRTYNGISLSISDWAVKLNISKHTLKDRLAHGWTLEKTLTTPPVIYKQTQQPIL